MASSTSAAWRHDVFLSFRGTDTRSGFTSHLYHSLRRMGIKVFIDNKLERGEEIWRSLIQEIESSRICVVIISQNYADSTYCLDELVKIIECRKSNGQIVLPVFYKVDTTDIEELGGSFGKAFADHEAKFNEELDKVEEWKSALRETVNLAGWPVNERNKDAECLDEIISKICKVLYDGKLQWKLQELQGVEAEMSLRVNQSESALSKKQTNAFENWFKDARRIENEAQSMCKEVEESRWTLTLADKVEKIFQEATKLIEQKGTLERILKLDASQLCNEAFPTKTLVGRDFQANIDLIFESLSSDKVSIIGIYGMGGVGKTTLMTHVYNKLLENKQDFPRVYWVTMSQDFNVYKLQSLIADAIGISLGRKMDERKRAAKLSKKLCEIEKFVLIVDDLWNHFDTTAVGIPIERNRSKLIITTRSLEVCRRINCQKVEKVVPLDEEEAWDLFAKTFAGKLLPDVEMTAKLVVKECSGLPLAIVTMAGSMRGIENLYEWRNVLTELQKSLATEEMGDKVFLILRYSYDRLNDPSLKECLLYCALFPEDYEIPKLQLIEYLIAERIIDQERNTRQEKLDKGQSMLNKLEYVCLLQGDCDGVKMHDLVRDMAVQILKEYRPSIVESGKQLTTVPNERHWRKDIIRVSLIQNDISEVPSNFSPSCPNLLTLLLFRNRSLENISDYFFDGLQGLQVLDLHLTSIEKLPKSLAKLNKLTALFVHHSRVSYIPTLANLKCLELLDLSFSGVKKVPDGLEMLSNLRYLNFFKTKMEVFPTGILPYLTHLQFLAFHQPSANAEELGGLRRLETLHWCFPSFSDLITYLKINSEMAIKYQLCAGIRTDKYLLLPHEGRLGHQLSLNGCTIMRKDLDALLDCDTVLQNSRGSKELKIINCDCDGIEYLSTSLSFFQSLDSLVIDGLKNLNTLLSYSRPARRLSSVSASSLKRLSILDCSVKKLFTHNLLFGLRNLGTLEVSCCGELEEIISGEDESRDVVCSLPNLRLLKLEMLPELRSICSEEIKCGNLQCVIIYGCEELRNIPICLPLPSLDILDVHPREWWETVKWGQFDQKPSLPFHKLEQHFAT